jgi:hypothetical protein
MKKTLLTLALMSLAVSASAAVRYTGRIISPRVQVSTSSTIINYVIAVDTQTGTPSLDTGDDAVKFSSNVIIVGDLEVRSTRANAIHLPKGGIHLSDPDDSPTAPGQMFAKKIKTSTITLTGSSIFFEDLVGVIKATMTATSLEIGEVKGKIRNTAKSTGIPPDTDCDEAKELGQQIPVRSPSRLYFCVDDGAGGAEWRYTNLSP